jgi:hypothetical protein
MFKQNTETKKINEAKLNEFAEKVMGDLAATLSSVMVNVGDRLGLYEALAKSDKPLDSHELSKKLVLQKDVLENGLQIRQQVDT